MAPSLAQEDHNLVSELVQLSKKKKKLVGSSTYKAPMDSEVIVRSWKMNEFKYYDVPSPFPTLARGLFTTCLSDDAKSVEGDEGGKHRIVARGYDKFFNIGEVPWTTWAALETHTSAPYVMTLKSNGCIIFIAALSPTKLLVTSKHSLGPIQNVPFSHAQMGEKWLLKHLEDTGKTVEQLARVLWDNNWTAVAELCDDSFEEHVLPYPPEKTGLHLHGINESTAAFKTLLSDKVTEFAREWGLIETPYHIVNSVNEVKAFSEEIAKSGKWNGEPIEGFVVRCHVAPEVSKDHSAPPYPPGSSFFFKVKYDEPYMMYRDWREITKSLLSAKGPIQDASVPKSKLRRTESKLYLNWVRDEIIRDRRQFAGFAQGKGIIATRERFLKWMQSEKSGTARTDQLAETLGRMNISRKQVETLSKTIIMPVAIPGCGKTTVAVALKRLFGFGHVQSDDIHVKKPAPIFIKRVMEELETHDVVIADKNNHLKQHRESLKQAIKGMTPPVRLLALNWALDKPPAMLHRICCDRVTERGDNHQTLRADADTMKHEEVIWKFLRTAQELSDKEADEVIEMDVEEDLEQSLDRAVDACVRVLGLPKPSHEDVGRALAAARGYKPAIRKEDAKVGTGAKPRYYGLLPEVDLVEVIRTRLAEDDAPADAKRFWSKLDQANRVISVPHVTLIHKNSLPEAQELWDRCHCLHVHSSPPTFSFKLGHLVYDDRVMAVTVEDLKAATNPGADTSKEAVDLVASLDSDLLSRLHITVGTAQKTINAIEARPLVESWKNGKSTNTPIKALPLGGIVVKGRVKGLNT